MNVNGDYVVEKRSENGTFERINLTKYIDYRRKCKFNNFTNKWLVMHPIIGKCFLIPSKNKKVTFISVIKNWHAGYYYCGTYEDEHGSHGAVNFENINSIDPDILKSVSEFKEEFIPLML